MSNIMLFIGRYAVINEPGATSYYMDEVHLSGNAGLRIDNPPSPRLTLDIRSMKGDGSGLLHAQHNQYFILEYEEALIQAFTTGVNLIIDEGAEVILPSTYYIYGTGVNLRGYSEPRSLQLYGRLTGVIQLSVTEGKTLYYGLTGHTAAWSNNTYTHLDLPGQFSMARVDLKSHAMLKYAPDTQMICDTGRSYTISNKLFICDTGRSYTISNKLFICDTGRSYTISNKLFICDTGRSYTISNKLFICDTGRSYTISNTLFICDTGRSYTISNKLFICDTGRSYSISNKLFICDTGRSYSISNK